MYYNENSIVYRDGKFQKATEAKGDLFDQSLHYGYGVFEGIRAYQTPKGVNIFKAAEHFQRMKYSAEAIGIPYPYNNDELIDISYQLLEKNNLRNAYIRPLVTCPPNMSLSKAKGSQIFIAVWNWGAYLGEKRLNIMTSSYRRINPSSFVVDAKVCGHYINSILASQEAKDKGFDEALMLDINGFVAEGPGANIFIEKDSILYTPKTGSILPGITRATVLEICNELGIPVVEKEILPQEIFKADSAFFCGTAAEVIGIDSLDKFHFPKDWETTHGAKIQKAYKDRVLGKNNIAELKIA